MKSKKITHTSTCSRAGVGRIYNYFILFVQTSPDTKKTIVEENATQDTILLFLETYVNFSPNTQAFSRGRDRGRETKDYIVPLLSERRPQLCIAHSVSTFLVWHTAAAQQY